MHAATALNQQLLLIGGGHSHALVLRSLLMNPLKGTRVTLISDGIYTPYSGMLPGLIADHYSFHDAHIDLNRLCRAAGVHFINDRVIALEPNNRQVLCRDHPPFAYDFLSLDTGSSPRMDIPGAPGQVMPVKPVQSFLSAWSTLEHTLLTSPSGKTWHLGSVGAGASGVEVLLAQQHRLNQRLRELGRKDLHIHWHLVIPGQSLLQEHNPRVRARFEQVLAQRNIQIHRGFRVAQITEGQLLAEDGRTLMLNNIIWAISATAPSWLKSAGIQVSPKGFIQVDSCLCSLSHPNILAAGDVADVVDHPRPKAGVFAVRQGPPLADNLRRLLNGQPTRPFVPQQQFLSLVSTGDRYAVASRGTWMLSGRWVWRWKDWIDRRFMAKFSQQLPAPMDLPLSATEAQPDQQRMRCGGCGAKVAQSVLTKALRDLPRQSHSDVLIGLDAPDDAAVLSIPANHLLVQTVDAFRPMVADPWLFGQIAANHALGDLFAMGAKPHSAQALVTLPPASESQQETELRQLLSGALKVFQQEGVILTGGHTAEGPELQLGFALNGLLDAEPGQGGLHKGGLRKGGLQGDDCLILTKPLGTGILFAADMRHQAEGRWVQAALASMCQSSAAAAHILRAHGARACTDITGFGLLGHLLEMLQASGLGAELRLDSLPALDGAIHCATAGWLSSLYPHNLQARRGLTEEDAGLQHPHWPLLFDPQTAGGLLAGIPAAQAGPCVRALQAAGYAAACIIGQVTADSTLQGLVRLT